MYIYIYISTPGPAIKTNTVEQYPAKRLQTYRSRQHQRRAKEHQLAPNVTNKSSKVARQGIKNEARSQPYQCSLGKHMRTINADMITRVWFCLPSLCLALLGFA